VHVGIPQARASVRHKAGKKTECNYPGRLRAPMTSAFTACLGKG
jgi:hypothetical protein